MFIVVKTTKTVDEYAEIHRERSILLKFTILRHIYMDIFRGGQGGMVPNGGLAKNFIKYLLRYTAVH